MITEQFSRISERLQARAFDPDVPVRVRMHDTMLAFLCLLNEARDTMTPEEYAALRPDSLDDHLGHMGNRVTSQLTKEEWAMVCPPLSRFGHLYAAAPSDERKQPPGPVEESKDRISDPLRYMAAGIVDNCLYCRLELPGDVEVVQIEIDRHVIRAVALQRHEHLPTGLRQHELAIVRDVDGYDVAHDKRTDLEVP